MDRAQSGSPANMGRFIWQIFRVVGYGYSSYAEPGQEWILTLIRPIQDGDIEAIVSVWREASDVAHPFLSKSFQDREAENVRNVYPKFAKIWVKCSADDVVGFIAVIETEVGAIFVRPSLHGRGHGRDLMDFVVKRYRAVTLDVFKQNAIGRRFYDKYGFRVVGEYLHELSGQPTLKLAYGQD